jgi:hypothetical protein
VDVGGCCNVCEPVIQDAFLHFDDCPIFQEEKQALWEHFVQILAKEKDGLTTPSTTTTNRNSTMSSSCVEIFNSLIDSYHHTHHRSSLIRHLCPHRCFLRGYSPRRDWMALRQSIHERTDQSVNILLRNWTCRLVRCNDDDDLVSQQENENTKDDKEQDLEKTAKIKNEKTTTNTFRKRKRTMLDVDKDCNTSELQGTSARARSSVRTEFMLKTTGKVRL